MSEEGGHGECACAHATLLTDTRRRFISLAENAGKMPGVELREPRNLCACVSEEGGQGDAHATLLTDTRRQVVSLAENAGRMPGVELREPRNLCACVSEDRAVSEK